MISETFANWFPARNIRGSNDPRNNFSHANQGWFTVPEERVRVINIA